MKRHLPEVTQTWLGRVGRYVQTPTISQTLATPTGPTEPAHRFIPRPALKWRRLASEHVSGLCMLTLKDASPVGQRKLYLVATELHPSRLEGRVRLSYGVQPVVAHADSLLGARWTTATA